MENFYLFIQYSAIQSIINRHDRLWSIAGISKYLQELNEVYLKKLSRDYDDIQIIICGGGKFTAKFKKRQSAENFKKNAIKLISTTFPLLEFQVSEVISGKNLNEVIYEKNSIKKLKQQKNKYRGYSISFLPHFLPCEECGEFPAIKSLSNKKICRICYNVKNQRDISFEKEKSSIDEIYSQLKVKANQIPYEFEEIFDENEEKIKRFAIWFSDLNSMKDKVILWLSQPEDKILDTFQHVRRFIINFTANTLKETFNYKIKKNRKLPFRIIIAGGDDLCIVMDEKYILDFTLNISKMFKELLNNLAPEHPLSKKWLNNQNKLNKEIAPLCFGGSFIVANYKTPFKRLFDIGEDLMKKSKEYSERKFNAVNWRIYIGEEVKEQLLFEKPLPILKTDKISNNIWSLEEYLEFIDNNLSYLSGSQIFQIAENLLTFWNDSEKLMKIFRKNYCRETGNLYKVLLNESYFYNYSENKLNKERIFTLFEIARIKRPKNEVDDE